jgi:hypothetical protein
MQGVGKKTEEIRPLGWGDDKLSEFLEAVRSQQFASFVNDVGGFYSVIREVDLCFAQNT